MGCWYQCLSAMVSNFVFTASTSCILSSTAESRLKSHNRTISSVTAQKCYRDPIATPESGCEGQNLHRPLTRLLPAISGHTLPLTPSSTDNRLKSRRWKHTIEHVCMRSRSFPPTGLPWQPADLLSTAISATLVRQVASHPGSHEVTDPKFKAPDADIPSGSSNTN